MNSRNTQITNLRVLPSCKKSFLICSLEGILGLEINFDDSLLALDPFALQEAGISRILTVMQSNPSIDEKVPINASITREYIMMKDTTTFQSHPWYETTSAIIDSALHAGERILIHW